MLCAILVTLRHIEAKKTVVSCPLEAVLESNTEAALLDTSLYVELDTTEMQNRRSASQIWDGVILVSVRIVIEVSKSNTTNFLVGQSIVIH